MNDIQRPRFRHPRGILALGLVLLLSISAVATAVAGRGDRTREVRLGGGEINGYRYGLIGSTDPRADQGEPCIFLHVAKIFGAARGGGEVGSCAERSVRHLEPDAVKLFFYGAGYKLIPDAELVAQGFVGRKVRAVQFRYRDPHGRRQNVNAQVLKLTADDARRLHAHGTFRHFDAFFPRRVFPPGRHRPLSMHRAHRVLAAIHVRVYGPNHTLLRSYTPKAKYLWFFLPVTPPPGYTSPLPHPQKASASHLPAWARVRTP